MESRDLGLVVALFLGMLVVFATIILLSKLLHP
jgi:hypothetical protein